MTSNKAVTKTYMPLSGIGDIHVGDIVIVQLAFDRKLMNTSFKIQDTLPAGLTFLRFVNQGRNKYLGGNTSGSMMDMHAYVSNYGASDLKRVSRIILTYQAIATAPGYYRSEPVYVADLRNNEFWLSEGEFIEVNR